MPAVETVAVPVEELDHVPPVPVVVKVVEADSQTDVAPLIVPAVGSALTEIERVATSVPQPLVTE
jgi:hypothetical protein